MKLSLRDMDSTIGSFEDILDNGSEEDVQQFLSANDFLLDGLLDYEGGVKLSKVKLGAEHVTDFVLLHAIPRYSNVARPRITFVEIERPNCPMFTKAGDPAAPLTHAVRQTQDWKMWIQSNRDYTSKTLQRSLRSVIDKQSTDGSGSVSTLKDAEVLNESVTLISQFGFGERYLVIAGRRRSLSMLDRLRLERLNEDLRDISIVTYDEVLDRFLGRLKWASQFYEEA